MCSFCLIKLKTVFRRNCMQSQVNVYFLLPSSIAFSATTIARSRRHIWGIHVAMEKVSSCARSFRGTCARTVRPLDIWPIPKSTAPKSRSSHQTTCEAWQFHLTGQRTLPDVIEVLDGERNHYDFNCFFLWNVSDCDRSQSYSVFKFGYFLWIVL